MSAIMLSEGRLVILSLLIFVIPDVVFLPLLPRSLNLFVVLRSWQRPTVFVCSFFAYDLWVDSILFIVSSCLNKRVNSKLQSNGFCIVSADEFFPCCWRGEKQEVSCQNRSLCTEPITLKMSCLVVLAETNFPMKNMSEVAIRKLYSTMPLAPSSNNGK